MKDRTFGRPELVCGALGYNPQLAMARIRVSFIDFLNSVPLGWGFLQGKHAAFELIFDVPSECARRLRDGEAEVGLIPAIEYQRIPGLSVIPGIAIASRREVRSVIFVSRVPIESVSTVALDTSSRTSAVLLKILFERFYGRADVRFFDHSPDPQAMLSRFESALLIGNPALQVRQESLWVYDLAHEWYRFTGLPFVFAFWAVRSGVSLGKQLAAFYDSREEGLRNLDRIADLYAGKLGLAPGEIRKYLSENLNYSLDPANLEGLQKFYELAAGCGLVPGIRPLTFHPGG